MLGLCMEHMWVLACNKVAAAAAMPLEVLSLLWLLLCANAWTAAAAAAGAIGGTGNSASLACSSVSGGRSGMFTSQVESVKKNALC